MGYNKYIEEFIDDIKNIKFNDNKVVFNVRIAQLSINYRDSYKTTNEDINSLFSDILMFEDSDEINTIKDDLRNQLNNYIVNVVENDFFDYVIVSYKLKNNKVKYLVLFSAYVKDNYIQKELIKMTC